MVVRHDFYTGLASSFVYLFLQSLRSIPRWMRNYKIIREEVLRGFEIRGRRCWMSLSGRLKEGET